RRTGRLRVPVWVVDPDVVQVAALESVGQPPDRQELLAHVQQERAFRREMCMDVMVADLEFDEWVSARVPALLRFAYLVTGSRDSADDVVQTVLARSLERWNTVRRTDDPDAYVRRMIINENVSSWRRWGKRQTPVVEVFDTARTPDPADGVSTADAVWRVCRALPERQRAAVVLRFYEDLSDREIASILECSESTVRSQIHRALAALRVELERQEAGDD
ncbi:SigE family RNA polymerase sigma factor, partial [Nocardioides jensenii]|uniref:SigE family RNA polymerase sigma factor n=1 Tax=Nocardioides jensenii TaxID=1843 RepID=UPI000B1516A1